MSDVKYCPSCGTALSISSIFCYKCGQKQEVETATEQSEQPEVENQNEAIKAEEQTTKVNVDQLIQEELSAKTEVITEETEKTVEPDADKTQIIEEPAIKDVHNEPVKSTETVAEQKPLPETLTPQDKPKADPIITPVQHPATPPAPPIQPVAMPTTTAGPVKKSDIPKKKFPWFFTVTWAILLLAVGGWGFYLYSLYSGGGDFPEFTEDAKRIVLYSGAIFTLLYTLSLKLSMKKFKVFPTIILVIACLVVLYFFCMVELTDGDWLHDFVSNITEQVLPASNVN